MRDPRRRRPLKPRTLSVLAVDAANFSRGLIADILRNLDVTDISGARDGTSAYNFLLERPIDVVIVSWEENDALDGLGFVRELRRLNNEALRRLPVIFVTSGLTRQMVIRGRDAGVDEFLARPISPVAMQQRLQMVIETPRPFVDCAVYVGPCRRRKNPADYHGAMRRAGDRTADEPSTLIDADEESARTPIRIELAGLRDACRALRGSDPATLAAAMQHVVAARRIAESQNDVALQGALDAFDAYVTVACPLGQIEPHVMETALGALEQLAVLPMNFTDARDSVARALGRAIQKKLAA